MLADADAVAAAEVSAVHIPDAGIVGSVVEAALGESVAASLAAIVVVGMWRPEVA